MKLKTQNPIENALKTHWKRNWNSIDAIENAKHKRNWKHNWKFLQKTYFYCVIYEYEIHEASTKTKFREGHELERTVSKANQGTDGMEKFSTYLSQKTW